MVRIKPWSQPASTMEISSFFFLEITQNHLYELKIIKQATNDGQNHCIHYYLILLSWWEAGRMFNCNYFFILQMYARRVLKQKNMTKYAGFSFFEKKGYFIVWVHKIVLLMKHSVFRSHIWRELDIIWQLR